MFNKFEAFMNKWLMPIAQKVDKQRHLSAIKAVSYTHLVEMSGDVLCHQKQLQFRVQQMKELEKEADISDYVKAVSYTHLDVYKRQMVY